MIKQKEYLQKYDLEMAKFSDFICLSEPKFTHSKTPTKKQPGGKNKKSRRTDEDIELIREAKLRAKQVKEAKVREAKNQGML